MTPDDIYQLLNRAYEMPEGKAKVAVLEEAVRIADVSGDLQCRYDAREQLIPAAFCSDEPEKLMVALSWCLGVFDENPEQFDYSSLLWNCKHALHYVTFFPSISLEQIERVQNDVVRRFQQYGASLRSVYHFIGANYLMLGRPETAREYYRRASDCPRDEFDDGDNWETAFQVFYLVETNQNQRGLRKAQPLLNSADARDDAYVWMASYLLTTLLLAGRGEEARRHFLRCGRAAASHTQSWDLQCMYLMFLALTSNFPRALRLLEKHSAWALESSDPLTRFEFYLAAWLLCRVMVQQGKRRRKLRLPESIPVSHEDGRYDLNELADWLEAESRDLAGRFNRRNGNERFSEILEETLKLDGRVTVMELKR